MKILTGQSRKTIKEKARKTQLQDILFGISQPVRFCEPPDKLEQVPVYNTVPKEGRIQNSLEGGCQEHTWQSKEG